MTKLMTLGGNFYETKQAWTHGTQMNVDDGNTFNSGFAFFEAFPEIGSFRGEANTIEAAEQIAWDKYQTFLSCEHSFKRESNSGLAVCEHCHVKGLFLENISVCECCEGKPIGYIGYKQYCFNHYLEAVDHAIANYEEKSIFSLSHLLFNKQYFLAITNLGLIKEDSSFKAIDSIFKELQRKVSETTLDIAEELANEFEKAIDDKTDALTISVLWSQNLDLYSDQIRQNQDVLEMILKKESDHIILSKCREIVF